MAFYLIIDSVTAGYQCLSHNKDILWKPGKRIEADV